MTRLPNGLIVSTTGAKQHIRRPNRAGTMQDDRQRQEVENSQANYGQFERLSNRLLRLFGLTRGQLRPKNCTALPPSKRCLLSSLNPRWQ